MVLQEKYRKIINEMTVIASDRIEAYFTDFTTFDIPDICECIRLLNTSRSRLINGGMVWCVRSTGTHLLYPETRRHTEDFPAFVNANKWFYYISLEAGTITEITQGKALEIVKNWQEV